MLAATAAAEPLEEPPGVWPGWCGLRVLPGVRVANSVVTVLPMTIAPAARSRSVTAASRDGVRPACSTDPFSVGMSAVSMMSLRPTGTPCSAPSGRPDRRHSSAARACAIAWSGSRKVHACTSGSTRATRSRQAETSSPDSIVPVRISPAASVAGQPPQLRGVHGAGGSASGGGLERDHDPLLVPADDERERPLGPGREQGLADRVEASTTGRPVDLGEHVAHLEAGPLRRGCAGSPRHRRHRARPGAAQLGLALRDRGRGSRTRRPPGRRRPPPASRRPSPGPAAGPPRAAAR